jgi:N utilization substance protein A
VSSNDPNVDPKGACVGARGSRVRQVVNELRSEKVDVVQWREDVAQFIAEALGPAKVKEVRINEAEKEAVVIVNDHQLSLAIGREGQNARLAARLSGYRVDIRSESQERGDVDPEEPGTDAGPAAAQAAQGIEGAPLEAAGITAEEEVQEDMVVGDALAAETDSEPEEAQDGQSAAPADEGSADVADSDVGEDTPISSDAGPEAESSPGEDSDEADQV